MLDRIWLFCQLSRKQHCTFSSLAIFCLITDEIQCKDNPRGTRSKSFILRSQSVQILFTVRSPFTLSSVCVLRSLIVHSLLAFTKCCSACSHRSLRVCSCFAQSALTVNSSFKWKSGSFQFNYFSFCLSLAFTCVIYVVTFGMQCLHIKT